MASPAPKLRPPSGRGAKPQAAGRPSPVKSHSAPAEPPQTLTQWARFRLGVRDANPLESARSFWHALSQAATIGMFLFFLVVALSLARTILLPIVLAFVIGTMLTPVSNWAARRGIPDWASAILLVLLFIALCSSAIVLLSDPVRGWIALAPEIGRTLQQKLQILDRPIAALNELRQAITSWQQQDTIRVDITTGLLEQSLVVITPAVGQLLLFVGTLLFFLAGRESLRQTIVSFSADRETRLRTLRILKDIERNLTLYLVIVTPIYAGVGMIVAFGAFLIGLPNPAVWGVLAFVLNFVPYLGPAIMAVVLFGAGLVFFPSLTYALIAPAGYVALVTLEGQFVTPSILGRQLTLNPLIIFLAIAFWAWLWGPFGALIANPLLIVGMVALKHLFPKNEMNLPA
jgi:predicted PurR-regulated permease PerM